jgi:nucleoside-diphosphate-sugar epimerase
MGSALSFGNLLNSDLEDIVRNSENSFSNLNSKDIVILGGTGFVGKWLVSSLIYANEILNARNRIHLYSRNPENTREIFGDRSENRLTVYKLDLMSNSVAGILPNADLYIHSATPSVADTGSNSEETIEKTTQKATRLIIQAIQQSTRFDQHVMHLSSGAVYFEESVSQNPKPEIDVRKDQKFLSKYAGVKLATEFELKKLLNDRKIPVSNPRLFAFGGPYIALDRHFAIGNFMRDAISGRDVEISGNSRTMRSYMYPSDLITILIKLMEIPHEQPINIGSPQPTQFSELAMLISSKFGTGKVTTNEGAPDSAAYYPTIVNQEKYLPSDKLLSLEVGLDRWHKWLTLNGRI